MENIEEPHPGQHLPCSPSLAACMGPQEENDLATTGFTRFSSQRTASSLLFRPLYQLRAAQRLPSHLRRPIDLHHQRHTHRLSPRSRRSSLACGPPVLSCQALVESVRSIMPREAVFDEWIEMDGISSEPLQWLSTTSLSGGLSVAIKTVHQRSGAIRSTNLVECWDHAAPDEDIYSWEAEFDKRVGCSAARCGREISERRGLLRRVFNLSSKRAPSRH